MQDARLSHMAHVECGHLHALKPVQTITRTICSDERRLIIIRRCTPTTTPTRPQPLPLNSLPTLNKRNEAHHTPERQSPLPGQTLVSEHHSVNDRDIDTEERRQQPSDHSPEQKAVLPQSPEDGESARVLFRIHIEQTAIEVLCLPCHDGQQDSQNTVRRPSSAERKIASLIVRVIAISAQIAIADAIGYDDEADQAQSAHEGAVDEFVGYEFFGEDAGAEGVRWSDHDVGGGFFEA